MCSFFLLSLQTAGLRFFNIELTKKNLFINKNNNNPSTWGILIRATVLLLFLLIQSFFSTCIHLLTWKKKHMCYLSLTKFRKKEPFENCTKPANEKKELHNGFVFVFFEFNFDLK